MAIPATITISHEELDALEVMTGLGDIAVLSRPEDLDEDACRRAELVAAFLQRVDHAVAVTDRQHDQNHELRGQKLAI